MGEHSQSCICHLCLPGKGLSTKPPINWEDGYRQGVSEGRALEHNEQNTFRIEVIEDGINLDYIKTYLSNNFCSPWFIYKFEMMLADLGLKLQK